eukprot:GFYU01012623.1.p1 GENE.GFYU01012623.1~~GFYU01012623.1.p1  ORF type:complete len:480 (+),score=129.68 GFYU01012623.1:147-1586(+)
MKSLDHPSTEGGFLQKWKFLGGTVYDWITLLCGILLMLVSGTCYSFGSFSEALKTQLNLTNDEATMAFTIGNIGVCSGAAAGAFYDKYGVRTTSMMGMTISGLGFGLLAALIAGAIEAHVGLLYFFFAVLGQGSQFTYMLGLCTYQNFPIEHRGKIVGVLDCMFGLSAAVFSSIYGSVYQGSGPENAKLYQYFIMCGAVVVTANVLAFFIIRISIADDREPSEIASPRSVTSESTRSARTADDGYTRLEDGIKASDPSAAHDMKLLLGEEVSGFDLVYEPRFWLVGTMFLIFTTIGLQFISNTGYIAKAVGKGDLSNAATIYASVSGTLARVTCGVVSDLYVHKISRAGMLTVICAVMVAQSVALVFWLDTLFIPASLILGAGFGSMWCLVPLIVSEELGVHHFGFNWGTIMVGSALGPLAMQPLQNYIYADHQAPDSNECYGNECYQVTWVVLSALALIGLGITAYLAKIIRKPGQVF